MTRVIFSFWTKCCSRCIIILSPVHAGVLCFITDCIRKNYTIWFEVLQKKVKTAWPQEFRQYSKTLLAVCSFFNDVIPLLESNYMLNLVIEGKKSWASFVPFSPFNCNPSTIIIDWNTELSGENSMKLPNLFLSSFTKFSIFFDSSNGMTSFKKLQTANKILLYCLKSCG